MSVQNVSDASSLCFTDICKVFHLSSALRHKQRAHHSHDHHFVEPSFYLIMPAQVQGQHTEVPTHLMVQSFIFSPEKSYFPFNV